MRIQFRRDSSAAWATFNTILAEAELGWDRTVKRFKIGDGITTWQNLPWYSTGEGESGGLVDSVNGQIGTVILDAEDEMRCHVADGLFFSNQPDMTAGWCILDRIRNQIQEDFLYK